MKILRFEKKEVNSYNTYGYFNPEDNNIYIRNDFNGYDYFEILIHEIGHFIIHNIVPINWLKYKIHMVYDMFDSLILTWDFNLVRNYYRFYKN